MQYKTMPGSNDKLSILGYGCARLPAYLGGELSGLIDRKKALSQIRYAIDQGVNYLDTGYEYHAGASESFLGEYVLKEGYREKVKIATKLPCYMISREEDMEKFFNKQLEKLQVETIDYYLLHALDGPFWEKMKPLGITRFMDRIRKEGRVRHMGFSFHGLKSEFMKITDEYNWEFAQVQFNILDEHYQAGIEGIEYAAAKNMGIIVMEPLRGGTLAGKVPKEVRKIYETAGVKRSPADWALKWVWNHPAVTVVLSGMNKMEHIKENIALASEAAPGSMSETEIEITRLVRESYNKLLKVGCTGCAYCMPCPAGINIPEAFKNLNDYHMFSKTEAKLFHASFLGWQTKDRKPHWTGSCLNCGKCEERCPQNIPVREVFKEVRKKLEGPFTKATAGILRHFYAKKADPTRPNI